MKHTDDLAIKSEIDAIMERIDGILGKIEQKEPAFSKNPDAPENGQPEK